MIRGEMNASLDAVVRLAIAGPSGDAVRLPFVVDTGFTGAITLPSKLVAALDLPEVGIGEASLLTAASPGFPIVKQR